MVFVGHEMDAFLIRGGGGMVGRETYFFSSNLYLVTYIGIDYIP